jgi:formylmethanofuran--tetrahydromethanopterin N-formyltransferase
VEVKLGQKKYKKLVASTNENYCPTLKGVVNSELDENVNSVLEIVMDAVDEDTLKLAMKTGIKAAANSPGVVKITAGNFDGKLGKYQIHLKDLL